METTNLVKVDPTIFKDMDLFQVYSDLERELNQVLKEMKTELSYPYRRPEREREIQKKYIALMEKKLIAEKQFSKEYELYIYLKTIQDFETLFEQVPKGFEALEVRPMNAAVKKFTNRKPRRSSFNIVKTLFKSNPLTTRPASAGGKRTKHKKNKTRRR